MEKIALLALVMTCISAPAFSQEEGGVPVYPGGDDALRRRLRASPAEFQILSVPLALNLSPSYLLTPQDRQRASTEWSACHSLVEVLSVNESSRIRSPIRLSSLFCLLASASSSFLASSRVK